MLYTIKINEPQLSWLRTAIYHTGLDVKMEVTQCTSNTHVVSLLPGLSPPSPQCLPSSSPHILRLPPPILQDHISSACSLQTISRSAEFCSQQCGQCGHSISTDLTLWRTKVSVPCYMYISAVRTVNVYVHNVLMICIELS